jgi:GH15 family glucan-1,4-alpha-glucosidase
MAYQPIENYGVIGDLHTVALISNEASIDFLCLPDFDSPTVFAALLDQGRGGCYRIVPKMECSRRKQMYLPDTNILLTRFLSENAVAEIIDFMPVDASEARHRIIRNVKVIKGVIEFSLQCKPSFDYGRTTHDMKRISANRVDFLSDDPKQPLLQLVGSIPIKAEETQAEFSLRAGQTASFVFQSGSCDEESSIVDCNVIARKFDETSRFWRAWIAKSTYKGRWREMVNRSALVLKLLTSCKHGSVIAAPTFGLPEQMGGERNWDYRYTWMRDAAFTLYAFMRLGYTEEAQKFMLWLRDRVKTDAQDGPLQVLYRANGGQDLEEISLGHLEGYAGSQPVRIGNAASTQLQLDIYGELMDAVYLATKYGDAITHDSWKSICRAIKWVAQNWMRPDEGIWEVRGGRREFLHSRLMCWVAVNRALRLAEKQSLPAPFSEWQVLRTQIYDDIFASFWNVEIQAFVAYAGAHFVDASALLMPLVRFISPIDPRWLSTMTKIDKDLTEGSLVYRYNASVAGMDGLDGHEGAFTACSFWYIECLARSHQMDKARLLFEKMMGYANHLGLYSEELGSGGEHLGNFPQALAHLALISAATYLDREQSQEGRGEWR